VEIVIAIALRPNVHVTRGSSTDTMFNSPEELGPLLYFIDMSMLTMSSVITVSIDGWTIMFLFYTPDLGIGASVEHLIGSYGTALTLGFLWGIVVLLVLSLRYRSPLLLGIIHWIGGKIPISLGVNLMVVFPGENRRGFDVDPMAVGGLLFFLLQVLSVVFLYSHLFNPEDTEMPSWTTVFG
jgi:hypothetical protein